MYGLYKGEVCNHVISAQSFANKSTAICFGTQQNVTDEMQNKTDRCTPDMSLACLMHSLVRLSSLLTHLVRMALQAQEDVSYLVQMTQDTWRKETTLVGLGLNGLHSSKSD